MERNKVQLAIKLESKLKTLSLKYTNQDFFKTAGWYYKWDNFNIYIFT